MKRAHVLLLPIAALALCACRATQDSVPSDQPSEMDAEFWTKRPSSARNLPAAPKPVDGNATAPSPGSVRTVEDPLRPIEGAPTGRVWLLEMYQNAVNEKERLARVAADTARDRDAALAHAAELEKSRADLESRNAALASEVQKLQTKSLELARRLAESELARLEAEKAALDGHTVDAGAGKP
jgi:hypothetical protein